MQELDTLTRQSIGEMMMTLEAEGSPHKIMWINRKVGGFLVPCRSMKGELGKGDTEKISGIHTLEQTEQRIQDFLKELSR